MCISDEGNDFSLNTHKTKTFLGPVYHRVYIAWSSTTGALKKLRLSRGAILLLQGLAWQLSTGYLTSPKWRRMRIRKLS